MRTLIAQPLTAEAFAPFGDVIQLPAGQALTGNQRFDDLVRVEAGPEGRAMVSLLSVGAPIALPLDLQKMERHPLGSQAFIPCGAPGRLVVVVAPPAETPDLSALRAFITDGHQGVNYLRGVWHTPISALSDSCFMVVDRHGPGGNCDFFDLSQSPVRIVAA